MASRTCPRSWFAIIFSLSVGEQGFAGVCCKHLSFPDNTSCNFPPKQALSTTRRILEDKALQIAQIWNEVLQIPTAMEIQSLLNEILQKTGSSNGYKDKQNNHHHHHHFGGRVRHLQGLRNLEFRPVAISKAVLTAGAPVILLVESVDFFPGKCSYFVKNRLGFRVIFSTEPWILDRILYHISKISMYSEIERKRVCPWCIIKFEGALGVDISWFIIWKPHPICTRRRHFGTSKDCKSADIKVEYGHTFTNNHLFQHLLRQ